MEVTCLRNLARSFHYWTDWKILATQPLAPTGKGEKQDASVTLQVVAKMLGNFWATFLILGNFSSHNT